MSFIRKLFSKSRDPLRATQEFILDLNSPAKKMKRVYMLSEDLKADPEQVELTQALTLNSAKPRMGLRGEYGLFATEEWWNNINTRVIPLEFVSGIILKAYEAGQDQEGVNNTVILKMKGNETTSVGIYTNTAEDIDLFQNGHAVSIVYALNELKKQPAPDGSINYSKVALEMLVSLQPVASNASI